MQKFLKTVIILFAFITIGCLFFINSQLSLPKGESREIYVGSNSSNAKVFSGKEINFIFNKFGEGVTLVSENIDPLEYLEKNDAKLIRIEEINGGKSYYAYSKDIKYCKILFGEKVNLHLYVKGNEIKIGCPIIFGSY